MTTKIKMNRKMKTTKIKMNRKMKMKIEKKMKIKTKFVKMTMMNM
jgi:hypothetical protein